MCCSSREIYGARSKEWTLGKWDATGLRERLKIFVGALDVIVSQSSAPQVESLCGSWLTNLVPRGRMLLDFVAAHDELGLTNRKRRRRLPADRRAAEFSSVRQGWQTENEREAPPAGRQGFRLKHR